MKNVYHVLVVLLLGIIATELFFMIPKTKKDLPEEAIESVVPVDTLNLASLELTRENFHRVCTFYEIAHPEIVYAQAILESGNFTSSVYQNKNNFLGLYNSRKKEYYSFNHWSDCLRGYKDFVQVKWDGDSDYYQFLKNLPYAMDPKYIGKIQTIVKRS